MSDLIAYVEDLESGRRKPTISGIKRVLRNLGKLDRPALLHGFFDSWDEFGDDQDMEWRQYRDPFLLARLKVFTSSSGPVLETARDTRVVSEDLSEQDMLWRRFRHALPEDPRIGRDNLIIGESMQVVLLSHSTGRYPSWPDAPPYAEPLLVRVPEGLWEREGEPLDRGYVDMSIAGYATHFGTTPGFTQWLATQGVSRMFVHIHLTRKRTKVPKVRFSTKETYPRMSARAWSEPGTLTAHVHLPRQLLRTMADSEVNFEERGRRVFSDAMRALRDVQTSKN